jgi:hypothetical protein
MSSFLLHFMTLQTLEWRFLGWRKIRSALTWSQNRGMNASRSLKGSFLWVLKMTSRSAGRDGWLLDGAIVGLELLSC